MKKDEQLTEKEIPNNIKEIVKVKAKIYFEKELKSFVNFTKKGIYAFFERGIQWGFMEGMEFQKQKNEKLTKK